MEDIARRASSISKAKNVMESTASTDRTVTDSTAKVRKTSVSNTIRTRALISKKGNEQGQHKKDHKFGPRDGQPTPPPDAGFQPRPDGQMQPEE